MALPSAVTSSAAKRSHDRPIGQRRIVSPPQRAQHAIVEMLGSAAMTRSDNDANPSSRSTSEQAADEKRQLRPIARALRHVEVSLCRSGVRFMAIG